MCASAKTPAQLMRISSGTIIDNDDRRRGKFVGACDILGKTARRIQADVNEIPVWMKSNGRPSKFTALLCCVGLKTCSVDWEIRLFTFRRSRLARGLGRMRFSVNGRANVTVGVFGGTKNCRHGRLGRIQGFGRRKTMGRSSIDGFHRSTKLFAVLRTVNSADLFADCFGRGGGFSSITDAETLVGG